jgi:hypothetical protein
MPTAIATGTARALLAMLVLAAPHGSGGEEPTALTFDAAKPGSLPAGLRPMSSSEREPGRWQVTRVDSVAALSQTDLGRHGYRLAVVENVTLRDVRVGVRLRVGGGDRAAGVAWRVQNPQNYYAVRLDFEKRQVLLYKFVEGNRIRLSALSGIRLDADAWHELVVDHEDTKIRVWLNGIPVASDEDDGLRTAGSLGFWTPGDGTAHFSRLWFQALERDR